jgi:AcrR family transcriptional regulator
MTDVRRRILDASVELVAEQGVRAVSFREAARRAGVSHQAPYHHFGDYQGILYEIAREGFAELSAAMRRAGDSEDDPLDALTAAGMAYVDFARGRAGHFRVMFQAPPSERATPPPPEATETRVVLAHLAARAVEAGHGHGHSAEAVAALCWAVVHGLAALLIEGLLAEQDADSTSPAVVIHDLADLLR